MLLLLVKYTAKPGGGEKFVREITASGILNTVRAEDGCEGYDYYFLSENPDTGLLVEHKREIYLGHLSRKNSFIKYQGIRS